MNNIFHTWNTIPILSLFLSISLLLGFYQIGKIIFYNKSLRNIFIEVSDIKYQYIIISVNFILIISYPITLFFGLLAKYYLILLSVIVLILGFYKLVTLLLKLKNLEFSIKKNINIFFVFVAILGYFLISSGPITSADSLDYHLYVSKFLAENGEYPNSLNHFHTKLSGAGEIIITLGLISGAEQFGSIIQFTGILSIIGVLKKNSDKIKDNLFYIIVLLGSPVLLFFCSSLKPQLFQIASTSLVFSILLFANNVAKKDIIKKYLLSFLILAICTQVKFSFMLSYFILGLYILYDSFKNKIFIKTFFISILTYIVVMLPPMVWKKIKYETDIFNLILNPFPIDKPGLDNFYNYLINAGRSNDIILGIIIPDNFSTMTNALGIGILLYFVLFKKFNKNLIPIILITSFFIIGYFKGQPASRFFFEPFVWILIVLNKSDTNNDVPKLFKFLVVCQFFLVIPAIIYGAYNLSQGNINSNFRDKVLTKNASGYSLFKWANYELKKMNYEGPIFSMHRSISLSNNLPISSDVFWLTFLKEEKYNDYLAEIKNLNPRYILSYGTENNEQNHILFKKCQIKLVKMGEKVGNHASRKPFGRGNIYNGYLFEIDTKKLPNCLDYDKLY